MPMNDTERFGNAKKTVRLREHERNIKKATQHEQNITGRDKKGS